jgi:hypothetical protein
MSWRFLAAMGRILGGVRMNENRHPATTGMQK